MLFKLRTRMFDSKANFPSMFINNLQCDQCDSDEIQTQRHLLENCEQIIINSKIISDNILVEHDHIYGNLSQQLDVTKLYIEIQEIREKISS